MESIAERDSLLHTRLSSDAPGQLMEVRTTDRPRREPSLLNHVGDGPIGEQLPVRDIGESMTALGFIHVMGRDEKCEPLGSQLMNLFPELSPRFGIDAGCRLIEQEQLRPMDQAGSQRQPLFPAA